MFPVGIDLGTTFSAIAYVDVSGRPSVIKNDQGVTTTPSVVCWKDGVPLIGDEAKALQALGYPVAAFFKRQMGLDNWVFFDGEREHSAIDLSAIVLGKLKADAERTLGVPVVDVVITVPAYFRNPQREATIAAGRRAGLNVLQVVNEPTAAAVAYGMRATAKSQLVLVYDLGGGTFDVTLLRLDPNEIRVLTSDGDHELGGKDWDDRIIEFVGQHFLDEFGVNPLSERESLSDVLIRAEEAKRRLSATNSARISIVHEGYRGNYELTRSTFEDLTADLMQRTLSLTRKVLADQKIEPSQLDGVLLVGGSTRMPMIHDVITRVFGQPPLGGVNVDEAVALGAALVAAERTVGCGRTSPAVTAFTLAGNRRTVDVTNHSLGMIAVNEDSSAYVNSIILPKNQAIPCLLSRPYQYRNRRRGPGELEVFMTQGESPVPSEVTYLGRHVVHDVPADQSGMTVIDIEYQYDVSATVQVTAKVRSGGQALCVTVEPLPDDVPERFLGRPADEVIVQHVTAYLAFDLSGSMSGSPIVEAQKAARGFLEHTDLAHCSLGIIGFSDSTTTKLQSSQDARAVNHAIGGLTVGETGYGNATHPFDELLRLMGDLDGPRFGIILADGSWSNQKLAVQRAKACKEQGIDIIAIGFGSADQDFLEAISSSSEVSFFTSLDGLVETFCSIAQVLTESGGNAVTTPAQMRAIDGVARHVRPAVGRGSAYRQPKKPTS